MIESVVIQPGADTGEPSVAGVSWPAVAAGAVVSCALTLVLLAFGTGLGLSVVSPWSGAGVSATTFKIGTGLYLIVIAMMASSVGGYVAGRLRTRWIGVHSDEVCSAIPRTVLVRGPSPRCFSGFAGKQPDRWCRIPAAGQAAASAVSQSGPSDGYVDTLMRSDTPASQNAGNAQDSRGEMARLFTSSLRNGGEFKPADRAYVSKVVAARTGLSRLMQKSASTKW